MLYPEKLLEIEDGVTLYIPDPERVKTAYENQLAKDNKTPFPFWARIWPSAIAMSAFLKAEPQWIEGRQVLELGAGIGLPSFAVAKYASAMVISDHAPAAVALMEKNIRHMNLQHVRAMRIDWNHFPEDLKAETLLLSDINYAPDQFNPLLVLIRKFLEQGTSIILTTPQRITITPFAEALQPFIKRSVLQTVGDSMKSVEIRILILSMD